ncbi:aspartate 4-decarboxylase [Acidobacterium sp. S8]|uniref:aspartate 4-decarboxylase n=1 Tax=Acidobacterium sp. S8 TaxID=1641854 RepID=UPI00131A9850|nr:aspartate 4-decarboxylase [Acidobacterium sp. S8]
MSASGNIRRLSVTLEQEKEFEKLSPFELKDKVIQVAGDTAQHSARSMLNAGRGNPNWIATTPRDAFFTLGQFAIEEAKRAWDLPDLGGMPQKPGIAGRLADFAKRHDKALGVGLLTSAVKYGASELGFDPDAFVHELVDGIIGDQYPTPDRMLVHAERVVHEYLVKEMCAGKPPAGKYDIFAVEGGTAAMCYIFDSLMVNHLLHRGDRVALALPMFTPYIEIAHLDRFHFDVVEVNANEVTQEGRHTWQYPDEEIDKLTDPSIKALFFVNPSNPPSVAMRAESMSRLSTLIQTKRQDLMIVTDDVYGTFVPGFRSLMANVPHNTIGVYSYSKYFGCTGWRLGVIAIHQDNVFDKMIANLSAAQRDELNTRYSPLTLEPEKIKFIDRMVADSRCVALNHTAGLSLPQQVQMTLFSLFALLDKEDRYKKLTQQIVHRRRQALWDGMGLEMPKDPNHSEYYTTLDLMVWAEKMHGPEFMEFLRKNYHPFDVLFALAERYSTVLMNGSGFAGPEWSVRVSLANLPDDAYPEIGKQLAAVVQAAVDAWKAQETS